MWFILSRRQTSNRQFEIGKGVKFSQLVTITTDVTKQNARFGIEQSHIDRFIDKVKELEIGGRKFRTKYQITMTNGSPQAENFLWTILGNKVCKKTKFCLKGLKISLLIHVFFRKPKRQAIDFGISNRQHCIGRSSLKWRPRWEYWIKLLKWLIPKPCGNWSTRWRLQRFLNRRIKQKKIQ